MLDAMESNAEGNKNAEGKCRREKLHFLKKNIEEVRRKNETYFLHFPSYYLERLA